MKVAIIGGSLGGLALGMALKKANIDFEIYERSNSDLSKRGGGIVLQPDLIDFIIDCDLATVEDISNEILERMTIYPDNSQRIYKMPQNMTSWSVLYNLFVSKITNSNYHQGYALKSIHQKESKIDLSFENGQEAYDFDFVIGVDGVNSVVRDYVTNDASYEYAGYVAFRGVENIEDFSKDIQEIINKRFVSTNTKSNQMLMYLIPEVIGSTQKKMNWVWYTKIPESKLNEILKGSDGKQYSSFMPYKAMKKETLTEIKQYAKENLPDLLSKVIKETQNPFLQTIIDVKANKLVNNNIIILGDSSSTPRPHTAMGVAKAISAARELADILQKVKEKPGDYDYLISSWENENLLIADALINRGKMIAAQMNLQ